ncbi:MAG: hypothetical protein HY318_09850 [Armatimonadetes bacterium]|nr:hypothetical protein [Armatimonadota bacterium]
MPATTLKRQIISDAEGNPVGVLLPLAEFELVEPILKRSLEPEAEFSRLLLMEQAAADPLFLADLQDTMQAFAAADGDWWERQQ